MRINDISGFICQMPDACSILSLSSIAACKVLHKSFHGIGNGVSSLRAQIFHELFIDRSVTTSA